MALASAVSAGADLTGDEATFQRIGMSAGPLPAVFEDATFSVGPAIEYSHAALTFDVTANGVVITALSSRSVTPRARHPACVVGTLGALVAPRSVFRRVVWAAAAVAVAAAAGTVALFSGSTVACTEQGGAAGPALRCAFEVAARREAVWNSFVATGEPRPYYFDAVLQADLRPGGRWRFVTDDLQRLLAGGEILVVESPRRLAQTFAAADLEDAPSRITVELEAVPGGTSVVLVHDGFAEETTTYRRFRRAHPLALSAMKSWLETGELPLRTRIYTAIFKPGMKRVSARAEPWS